jgi:hypothetical protein
MGNSAGIGMKHYVELVDAMAARVLVDQTDSVD